MCDLTDKYGYPKVKQCHICDGEGFTIENEFVGAPDEKVDCLKCSGSGVLDYTEEDDDESIDREADLLRD